MGFRFLALFLALLFVIIIGCGDSADESDDDIVTAQSGEIFGTVTDKETGIAVEGATVKIGIETALTDNNGKYTIKNIPFSNNISIIVTASGYEDYNGYSALQQELMSLDIGIVPSQSPSAPILAVLESISSDIEQLDDNKIPDITSYFSQDYVAGDDEATAFAIFAGVVPPNYDAITKTMENINKKYSKLTFDFANPEVSFEGNDSATVLMRFVVDATTNPPEPKKWDIIVDGKMIFEKQDDEWKMTFWGLIPPFIKFEENPI